VNTVSLLLTILWNMCSSASCNKTDKRLKSQL